MKARMILYGLILLPLLCAIAVPARAQTTSPQETLNQYVADLQKNPDDTALREKIIALALTMNPLPEVPAEAKRHMSRGVAAVEGAKTPDDFKDACNEFRQATTLAPWLANAYRNLAIAQDKAGMYDDALASLRLYLLTRPSSADADWAEDLKSKVEYRKEKAAKEVEAKARESRPEAIAARTQDAFEAFLNKIDGRRYTCSIGHGQTGVIDVRGGFFVRATIVPGAIPPEMPVYSVKIQGRVTSFHPTRTPMDGGNPEQNPYPTVFTVSEDGDRILGIMNQGSESEHAFVYVWQR